MPSRFSYIEFLGSNNKPCLLNTNKESYIDQKPIILWNKLLDIAGWTCDISLDSQLFNHSVSFGNTTGPTAKFQNGQFHLSRMLSVWTNFKSHSWQGVSNSVLWNGVTNIVVMLGAVIHPSQLTRWVMKVDRLIFLFLDFAA